MKIISTALGLLAALAMVLGCATTPVEAKADKPSAMKKYPEFAYLTAQGSGDSEPEAKNRALAELSKIFETQVRSETMDRVRSVVRTSGGTTTEDTQQRLEDQLSVISQVELKGAEVAETWKERSRWHALAVLERAKARDTWLGEIRSLDQKIAAQLDAAEGLPGRLMRYRSLKSVLTLWLEREVLVSRLSVLGYKEGGPTSYEPSRIFGEIPRIKAAMPIYLDISGNYAEQARAEVSKALGGAGFVVTGSRSGAPVVVSGTVEAAPVKLKHPEWQYARAAVALSVRDAEAGVSVGEVKADYRSAHLSYEEAATKAVKKLLPSAAAELVEFLERPPAE